jgi:hypothetical protein
MAAAPKKYSWAVDRELIKLAKTMDLEAIVITTKRKPEALLKIARRLGISLKSADRPKTKPR